MSAGGCDLERALGAFLALDVGEIEHRARCFKDLRLRPRQHLRALEMIGELNERRRGNDLDFGARPRGFGSAPRRADQSFATRVGADGGRKDSGDGGNRAVKSEFAEHGETGKRVVRNGADRRHQAERDRQIVVAAFLRQIRRRQIDGDAAGRQR